MTRTFSWDAGIDTGVPSGKRAQADVPARRVHALATRNDWSAQERRYAWPVRLGQDNVGFGLQSRDGTGHRHANLGGGEERVVVLGIADGHSAMTGDPQIRQTLGEAGALGHSGGQHHHCAAVADELAVQAELAYLPQHRRLGGALAGQQHLTPAERDLRAVSAAASSPGTGAARSRCSQPPASTAPFSAMTRSKWSSNRETLRAGRPGSCQ